MTTYYVDGEIGEDRNEGTSEVYPWRSVDRVNRAVFRAGDRILFAGGQTFAGTTTTSRSGAMQPGRKRWERELWDCMPTPD